MKTNTGVISLSLVFILTIIATMLINLRQLSVSTSWLDTAALKAEIAIKKEAHEFLSTLNASNLEGFQCNSITNTFCFLQNKETPLPHSSQQKALPYFDYSSYFKNTVNCPQRYRANPFTSHSGFSLTSTSFQSSHNCLLSSFNAGQAATYNENIVITYPTVLPESVASRGSIELSETTLETSSIMIAGGDILIGHLHSEELRYLTIISATGRIKIGSLSGSPRFSLYALRELDVPQNLIYSENAPLPKQIKLTHLSIY